MKQNCATCPYRSKCWASEVERKPRTEALALNLLVCRMKEGLKVDRTAKLILKMLRPKSISISNWIKERVPEVDHEHLLMEVESATIEGLLYHYKIHKAAYPLHYLYNKKIGYMSGWAKRYVDKHIRNSKNLVLIGTTIPADLEPEAPPSDDPGVNLLRSTNALRMVEDGVTLTTSEYRVLKFCLAYAGELQKKSVVSGLHKKLAAYAGWSRRKAGRHYEKASQKLHEHISGPPKSLPDVVDVENRRRRLLGLQNNELSEEEIEALVSKFDEAGISETCRTFVLDERAAYKYRREYAEQTST
jgi:hypothetical protein